jgi:hypothetical protein
LAPASNLEDAAGVIALLLLTLAADAGAPGAFEVREESYETFVTARAPGTTCPAWEWRRKSRQLRLHRCPGKPLAEETAALRALLVRLRAQETGVEEGSLLMSLDYLGHPDFVARLARHAEKARDRRPRQNVNQYAVTAAGAEAMLPELTEIFAGIGRRPVLSSAEKCSEARPRGKGPMSAWLRAQGFRGKEPLPMGCAMVWIRLVP